MMFLGSVLETIGVGMVPVFVAILADPEPVLAHARLQPLLGAAGVVDAAGLLRFGAILLLGVILLKNGYMLAYHHLEARYLNNRYHYLATRLFSAYMHAPWTYHLRHNSASMLRNITEESRFLVHEVLTPLMRLAMSILLVLAILVLLFVIEPLITLMALVLIGGAGGLFLYLIKRRVTEYGLGAHQARLSLIRSVSDALEGFKDLRVLRREQQPVREVEGHVRQYSRSQTFWMTALQANKPLLETIAVAGIMTVALVLWAQGRPVTAVIPILALFGAAAVRLLPDVKQMMHYINSLRYFGQSVVPVSRDWAELGAGEPSPTGSMSPVDAETGLAVPEPVQYIEFNEVSYTYSDSNHAVLDAISLRIEGGTLTGFAGPSGGGKTTVADLLLGLLEPSSGSITVNGMALGEWLARYPTAVGYIPQNIFLADDTLRRNIAFGLPDEQIDERAVEWAVRAARLEQVVGQFERGLDTRIGQRGVRLSGGQRQRIGIARALYHNPPLLVMDEATSALDHAMEQEVMQAVQALKGEHTILVIAHRTTTMSHCDSLWYLEQGRIRDATDMEHLARMQGILPHNS